MTKRSTKRYKISSQNVTKETSLTNSVRHTDAVVLETDVNVDARDARPVGQATRLVVEVDLLARNSEVDLKKNQDGWWLINRSIWAL